MSTTKQLKIKDLGLDLNNYRTVAQNNEVDAIKAMITISPDYFWGLMKSLLEDGYLPTENIIVLNDKKTNLVKEGNRRIAALKIIHGYINSNNFDLPSAIEKQIKSLSQEWLTQNESVPCTIYGKTEEMLVDKIVTLTHGKGQKAGRDDWETVARARHNKQVNNAKEYGLTLLEKYLKHGRNLSSEQKLRWSGRYNLTILDEVLVKMYHRVNCASVMELIQNYPNINYRNEIESIILAIGLEGLKFADIRSSSDFLIRYGIPPLSSNPAGSSNLPSTPNASLGNSNSTNTGTASQNNSANSNNFGTTTGSSQPSTTNSSASTTTSTLPTKVVATATNDIRTVKRLLRTLKLVGPNRTKLVDIRKEMGKLKLDDNPIAFIFLLRSMIELSAKAYCDDISVLSVSVAPKYVKSDGSDRNLSDILRDIVSYLTQNKADKQMVKLLHGPLTEIARPDGLLSITSMNQLVHNPRFVIRSSDIPALFTSIFPLIEKMNS
ncbi:hypothetical protein Q4R38_05210 [Morganella morganii]|nr:hypothetical protein [Morganella morganii]HEI8572884.1 hypothetical protein [Morganella morganii]